MLKNDNRILKNNSTGGTINIFKSQVVDSYLEQNTQYSNYISLDVSGSTENNPLKVYYITPSGAIKNTYTYNGTIQQSYVATNETSYKKFFFFGNRLGLTSFTLSLGTYPGVNLRGDLIRFMEQFPNLNTFSAANGYCAFNKNLTNTTFPRYLKNFIINDNTLSGEITTIKNFENIENLELRNCRFTKKLTDINFNNLTKVVLDTLSTLGGNLNNLINNNSNLNYLHLWNCPLWTGNTTTLDVSKLKYIYWYLPSAPAVTGTITNWTFNTGITSFQVYSSYLTGDMTNWDISNTKLTNFQFSNYNNAIISGDLSGWTLPSTLSSFYLYGCTGITSLPQDFSSGAAYMGQIYVYNSKALTDDINDITFGNNVYNINISTSNMVGDLETWSMPTGATSIVLSSGKFTGNVTGITPNTKITQWYLDGNLLTGELVNKTFPNTLQYLNLSRNTGITLTLSAGTFHTNKLTQLYLDQIKEIRGSFSNFVIDNNMSVLSFNGTKVYSDLSELDVRKITQLMIYSCPNMYGNLSNWRITGTTNLTTLYMYGNANVSGSTSNWSVNNITDLRIYNTSLSGALKHNNPQYLQAQYTNISSNIKTDFNFNTRAYLLAFNNCPNLTGSLSGVTLNYGIQQFYIQSCPNVTGSNEFTDYIFANRSYWTNSYVYFYYYGIGDVVSGASETMGDLGTYPVGGTNYQWNLTEEQINNLVAGTDYNGAGTNVKWNPRQKIYWMKNCKISSTNLGLRYKNFQIQYSY